MDCIGCEHWEEEENCPGYGACRRNAPIAQGIGGGMTITPGTYRAVWPFTRSLDGCGQWVKRTKKTSRPTQNEEIKLNPTNPFDNAVKMAKDSL